MKTGDKYLFWKKNIECLRNEKQLPDVIFHFMYLSQRNLLPLTSKTVDMTRYMMDSFNNSPPGQADILINI